MKKQLSKRMIALLLSLTLLLGLALPAGALDSGKKSVSFVQVDNDAVASSIPADRLAAGLDQAPLYKDSDEVRVSIVLSSKPTLEMGWSAANIADNASAMSYREELKEEQAALTDEISRTVLDGMELDVVWNLTLAANVISANVTYGQIEAIKAIKGVEDVFVETCYEPDVASEEEYDPNMATSSSMIGSGAVWAAGYTGAGSKVAVIDTGTDTDHQSFDAGAFEYAIQQTGKDVSLMTAEDIAKVFDKLNIAEKEGVTAEKLYLNAKLPFAYNYIDEDFNITHDGDSQGEHGSHVAGIATANRYIPDGEDGYVAALSTVKTQGVAPDAQLITMKVFGKGGGAYDSDYMAAIEDAIVLGCDSINLSLGSGNPGASTNDTYQNVLNSLSESGAVVCMSAGNSGTWQENTAYGFLYNDGVSMDTAGSPGSYTNSLGVASIDNSGNTGYFLQYGENWIGYNESLEGNSSNPYTNAPIRSLVPEGESEAELDFVLFENTGVDGFGNSLLTDYADVTKDKVVMVYRGVSSFYEKHMAAAAVGAKACIVVNNQAGTINMDLSDSTATIPCVSITQANGAIIKASATPVKDAEENVYYTGKITVSGTISAVQGTDKYYTMSSFSSWGIPGSLEMKPEITAPGGNIYSVNGAVAGGKEYENMSGTSMASPQMAGMAAVAAQYVRENDLAKKTGYSARQLIQSLMMSTAEPVIEADTEYYYSILNQGAGLANIEAAVNAHSYIFMADDANAGAADGKVKVELGDDPEKTGVYSFTYTLHNLTDADAEYRFATDVFTQDAFSDAGVGAAFLDTWTAPLPAVVSYSVDGKLLTAADAQAIADYASGKGELSDAQSKLYDVNGDGVVNTYDAHYILKLLEEQTITLPASGSITVTVSIDVSDNDFSAYPTGAYIEAYSYAIECSSEEGVAGTVHSIPVLGYYGSWSDPSMYDVGTLAEYYYGTEDRPPYLYLETNLNTNYLSVKYPGDTGEYSFFGNPLYLDDEYLVERNAMNSDSTLYKYYVSIIRNAGGAIYQITDANTGELYLREELGAASSAYYYSNGQAWRNVQSTVTLNWNGTDGEGKALPEDTEVNVSLVLAPEYYASADGSYDWDALTNGVLGEGAYMTTRVAIDNTAPVLDELTFDAETLSINFAASENRYLAAAELYRNGASGPSWIINPNQALASKGGQVKDSFGLLDSDLTNGGEFYLQLTDYAMNQTTYKFVITENLELDTSKSNPTKITLPATASLVKGTSTVLKPGFEPFMAKEEVVWSSSDESIATVDANGKVTGLEPGNAVITATSAYDESISASCTVTVKVYNVTLTGALQDENGNPQIFTWDLASDKTWKKTADLDNDINAVAYNFASEEGGPMYQMDTNGYLYQVDAKTGKTLASSAASAAFGAPVDDLVYGYVNSVNLQQEALFGVFGGYLLYSVPDMANTFDSGWNMAAYLNAYLGASSFTAIAWAGISQSASGSYRDVLCCLTDSGDFWVVMPDLSTGSAGMNYFTTDLNLSFPGYDGTTYCSMVMGDDGNFYLSYFTGSTNEIYALEEAPEGSAVEYTATLLGDIGDGVWPCGLLTVTTNETEEKADPAAALTEGMITVELEAEAVRQPEKEMKAATVAPRAIVKEAYKAVDTAETGRVYMDINAEDSTNGLITMDYDADVLTVEGVQTSGADIYSWNDKDGAVSVAWADAEAVSGKLATVVFSYSKGAEVPATDIVVTTKEECQNFEPSSKTVTVELDSHVIAVDEAVAPTCTEPGLTEGYHCAVCGKVLLAQQRIEPLGHSLVKIAGKDATCTMEGVADIWKCETCGKLFSDDKGATEIEAPASIPTVAHKLEKVEEVPATCTEPGAAEHWKCSVCGKLFSDDKGATEIEAPAEIPATGHSFADGECSVCHASDPAWEEPFVNPFIDVKESDWFYSYVMEMAKEGIINGYADNTFRPGSNLTRAEMVTLLYRASGSPEVNCQTTFTDVPANAWYLKQVAWAEQQGIVNGVGDGKFEPDVEVSREQLVTMLWRLAGKPEAEADLSAYDFADADKVSAWAESAMQWAVSGKIINGTTFEGVSGVYLAPQDSTTRAEAAKILCVYLEK